MTSERLAPLAVAETAHAKRAGIALMVGSAGLLTVGDAIAKSLSAGMPIGEIIFVRGVVILTLLVVWRWPQGIAALMPRNFRAQMRRAIFFVLATYLMIWSLSLLPLATASAISFVAPIITTALAPWLLREHVDLRQWGAVLAGFLGVLLIFAPVGQGWSWALLIPFGAAVAQSLRDIETRQMVETETSESVVFVTIGATVLMGALTGLLGWVDRAAFGWSMPSPFECTLFLLYGAVTCCAYLMQVGAFRAAEAAFLAPFKYSLIVWAVLIGFVVWGDVPSISTFVGVAIAIASGLFIWKWETGARAKHV